MNASSNRFLSHRVSSLFSRILLLSTFCGGSLNAADKIDIRIGGHHYTAYRTVDLEKAKGEAREKKQALAWIASDPKALQNDGRITGKGSRAGTSHAFAALGDRAVLVFMDAFAENHQCPKIVDEALHTPNPHYTPPTVVLLDAEMSKVLGVVIYDPDFETRKESFKRAILELEPKK